MTGPVRARPGPKLTARMARALAAADADVRRLEDQLRAAQERRDVLRARYRPRITTGAAVRAGGLRILVTKGSSGRRFSLKGYLAAGNKITAEMRPHVSQPTYYDLWSIKPDA